MKKKIPLAILEALQPVADNNLDLVKTVKDPNSMFHLIDKDENSDFFFKVVKQEARSMNLSYLIEFKPKSKEDVSVKSTWQDIKGVLSRITNWLALLQAYNKIRTIYDDPILIGYQERFEKQFEILDSDADSSSFDLAQQIFLDDYLNDVKSKLAELRAGRSETQIKDFEELEAVASDIQKNLTNETKRQIVKRLSYMWARAQKAGLDVIKEIFINVISELTTRFLTGRA